MEISDKLKDFLNDPKIQDLINDNKWEEVYKYYWEEFKPIIKNELTLLLFAIDINPLDYMDYIPKLYLAGIEITKFTIPQHIRSIGGGAFSNCHNLAHINIPNNVTYIENGAFSTCTSLKNIIIPDSVIELDGWVFSSCSSLTSLTLGKNLKRISGWHILRGTRVKSINYNNTMENWKKIEININNSKLYSCIIHCTDGDLKYDEKIKEWIEV